MTQEWGQGQGQGQGWCWCWCYDGAECTKRLLASCSAHERKQLQYFVRVIHSHDDTDIAAGVVAAAAAPPKLGAAAGKTLLELEQGPERTPEPEPDRDLEREWELQPQLHRLMQEQADRGTGVGVEAPLLKLLALATAKARAMALEQMRLMHLRQHEHEHKHEHEHEHPSAHAGASVGVGVWPASLGQWMIRAALTVGAVGCWSNMHALSRLYAQLTLLHTCTMSQAADEQRSPLLSLILLVVRTVVLLHQHQCQHQNKHQHDTDTDADAGGAGDSDGDYAIGTSWLRQYVLAERWRRAIMPMLQSLSQSRSMSITTSMAAPAPAPADTGAIKTARGSAVRRWREQQERCRVQNRAHGHAQKEMEKEKKEEENEWWNWWWCEGLDDGNNGDDNYADDPSAATNAHGVNGAGCPAPTKAAVASAAAASSAAAAASVAANAALTAGMAAVPLLSLLHCLRRLPRVVRACVPDADSDSSSGSGSGSIADDDGDGNEDEDEGGGEGMAWLEGQMSMLAVSIVGMGAAEQAVAETAAERLLPACPMPTLAYEFTELMLAAKNGKNMKMQLGKAFDAIDAFGIDSDTPIDQDAMILTLAHSHGLVVAQEGRGQEANGGNQRGS